jgi:hypothetical protein
LASFVNGKTKHLKTDMVEIKRQCTGHGFINQAQREGFTDPRILQKVGRRVFTHGSKESAEPEGQMETYFAQNGLLCLLCGRTYLALHLHLNKTHEMALDDYRARYGIPWTRGLVAKPLRDKQVANLKRILQDNRIPPSSPEHITAMLEAAKSRRPQVPATIESLTRTALHIYRRRNKLAPKDFEEYLRQSARDALSASGYGVRHDY